jgi:Tol biopolymer transport system component
MDLLRGLPTRFTFGPDAEDDPAWSADGSTILFTVQGGEKPGLYRKSASGAGSEEILAAPAGTGGESMDWSRDGKYALYARSNAGTGLDLWVFPIDGSAQAYPLMNSTFNEVQGRFSPDGRFVAYVSNESGRAEVYVRTFPDAGGKWQVSTGGGAQPRWRRDGKELFYVAPDRKLMSAEVNTGSGFATGVTTPLFQTQVSSYTAPNRYDVSADGQRFLVNSQVEETSQTPITVVLNWSSTLKKQP